MMIFRNIKKLLVWILSSVTTYFIISFILTVITVNEDNSADDQKSMIYLNTNGVHLDVIISRSHILTSKTLENVIKTESENYISFGWGDENFYINTPTWNDLTLKNAFRALFLKSATLMHVTRHSSLKDSWIPISLSENQLTKLMKYISESFKRSESGKVDLLEGFGYSVNDDFYKASGSYSCFKTCNSWVNSAFKTSGLKACLWTPFDFGLLDKYREQ